MSPRLSAQLFIIGVSLVTDLMFDWAAARPPEGADPALAPFYRSLTVPDGPLKGQSCCDVADCRPVPIRGKDGHWEVYIDSKTFPDDGYQGRAPNDWVVIPDDRIIRNVRNDAGDTIVCWYNAEVRCALLGPQT